MESRPDKNTQSHERTTIEDIKRGLYQHELYAFTYDLQRFSNSVLLPKNAIISTGNDSDRKDYTVYPLMDMPGLRATVAINDSVTDPLEICINFFGTIDFASEKADVDRSGPGQKILALYEKKLLANVLDVIEQLSIMYPQTKFTLRLSGHSLGGSLAKGFAHTLQRACAVQENTPTTIINTISEQLENANIDSKKTDLDALEVKLKTDAVQFSNMPALNQIGHIIVYALGAPGVSQITDEHASLLTYYHAEDFLELYHHYHEEDLIVKFGECEFMSGQAVKPRLPVNKVVQFSAEITKKEIRQSYSLPFPGLNHRVMAAHNKLVYGLTDPAHSTVTDLSETKTVLDKFRFPAWKWKLYEEAFSAGKLLSSIKLVRNNVPSLFSWPAQNIDSVQIEMKPQIEEDKVFRVDFFSEEKRITKRNEEIEKELKSAGEKCKI